METRGWGSEFKRSCSGKELSHKNYTATIAFNMPKSCGLSTKNSLGFIRVSGLSSQIHAGKRFRHVSSSIGRESKHMYKYEYSLFALCQKLQKISILDFSYPYTHQYVHTSWRLVNSNLTFHI